MKLIKGIIGSSKQTNVVNTKGWLTFNSNLTRYVCVQKQVLTNTTLIDPQIDGSKKIHPYLWLLAKAIHLTNFIAHFCNWNGQLRFPDLWLNDLDFFFLQKFRS